MPLVVYTPFDVALFGTLSMPCTLDGNDHNTGMGNMSAVAFQLLSRLEVDSFQDSLEEVTAL